MDEKFKNILCECVNLIESNFKSCSEEDCNKQIISIKQSYASLDPVYKNVFYSELYNATNDDKEFYTLVLSTIYQVTKDEKSILDMINMLINAEMDLFNSIIVSSQINRGLLVNNKMEINYKLRRELHKSLLFRLENSLNITGSYVELSKRDSGKIIIITKQLLSELHAPSKIVMEISALLQKEFHIKVLVIVALEEVEKERCQECWLNPFVLYYNDKYNGNFAFQYKGEIIAGYQFIMNKSNLNMINKLIFEINSMKPLFVWSIGDTNLFADLFRKYTTVVTESLAAGFPISEAQILVRYNKQEAVDKEYIDYFNESHQCLFLNDPYIIEDDPHKTSQRSLYGISDEAFVICIVGNRLDSEVTEEFVKLVDSIVTLYQEVYVVFIGNFELYLNKIQEIKHKDRIKYIGYQKDLPSIYKLVNLYLNPPRKGGGFSALSAIYNDVPVITLDNCDVATVVGRDFICDDLIYEIGRYINEVEFYIEKKKKCKCLIKSKITLKDCIKNVIENVILISA